MSYIYIGVAILAYWLSGYSLAFGGPAEVDTSARWQWNSFAGGVRYWALAGASSAEDASTLSQFTFHCTLAVLPSLAASAAVAERVRFETYALISAFSAGAPTAEQEIHK